MSSTVRSYGFIAILKNPISDEETREELSEQLYEQRLGIDLNLEGTLVYSDANAHQSSSIREDIYSLSVGNSAQDDAAKGKFIADLAQAKLEIDVDSIQPYNCIWYNGSDCPVTLMTKTEFQPA